MKVKLFMVMTFRETKMQSCCSASLLFSLS